MITYIYGKIVEIGENSMVLDHHGMGYEIFCSSNALGQVTQEDVKVYIYEHIKEDGYDLYGFATKEERELFKKLISVSGIGPKGGMQVLSLYKPSEVIEMIISQDSKALSKVSGIGPKTAQRIILELKDSIQKLYVPDLNALKEGLKDDSAKHEAIEALEALGYSSAEARRAVEAIFDYKSSSEELIRRALSLLGM